jgi:hypothetical protein
MDDKTVKGMVDAAIMTYPSFWIVKLRKTTATIFILLSKGYFELLR